MKHEVWQSHPKNWPKEDTIVEEGVMNYKAIVAMTEDGIIGDDGEIPWYYPEDLRYFRKVTRGHPVVMGRKTYESICKLYSNESIRKLGGPLDSMGTCRRQIVLTRDEDYDPIAELGVKVVNNYDECKRILDRYTETKPLNNAIWEEPFIIGGREIYDLFWDDIEELYVTLIHEDHDGDTHFPRDIKVPEEWGVKFNPYKQASPNFLSYMCFVKNQWTFE